MGVYLYPEDPETVKEPSLCLQPNIPREGEQRGLQQPRHFQLSTLRSVYFTSVAPGVPVG